MEQTYFCLSENTYTITKISLIIMMHFFHEKQLKWISQAVKCVAIYLELQTQ